MLNRITACIAFALASVAVAAEPISKSRFGGVVIGGHDSVAYHAAAEHTATQGVKRHVVEWKGGKWRFASSEHAEQFRQDPERYAPAYNGFCANALSIGEGLVNTDGAHWEIFGEQLHVFYAARGRTRWTSGDWREYKIAADQAWQEILAKETD